MSCILDLTCSSRQAFLHLIGISYPSPLEFLSDGVLFYYHQGIVRFCSAFFKKDVMHTNDYDARKRAFVFYSAQTASGRGRSGFLSQICRLELDQGPIDEHSVRDALDHVNNRRDCADFSFVGLIRLCYQYADHPLLSKELLKEIHQTILNFKYWVDEPGYDLMFYWTENHQILFHSAEYLAGQLFPTAVFPNAGLTGAEHMEKARERILNWIRLRARIGFSEWDSNCYYDEHMAPLINLADFAEDAEISEAAQKLLDVMFFDLAVDSFQGMFATSHGRTYPRHVLSGQGDAMTATQKIAFDQGAFISPNSMTAVSLSTSRRYRVPDMIQQIAQHRPEEVINFERHSFDLGQAERFGIRADDSARAMPMWAAGMFANRRTAQQTLGLADRFGSGCFDLIIRPYVEAVLKAYEALDERGMSHDGDLDRRTLSEVNKVTYRTPDYQLSCAQDYRKGKLGFQQHIWQATLASNTAVFTMHRGSDDDKSTKYWQGRLPRAVQVKNVVVAIYNIPDHPDPGPATVFPPEAEGNASPSPAPSEEILLPYTVAAFPRGMFDGVVERAGWIFARKESGYIALRSQQGVRWTPDGIFGTEGLIADGRQNVWVCQLGREAVDGDFKGWCDRIIEAEMVFGDLSVQYDAPGLGMVSFGWNDPLLLNGKAVALRDYPRFDNPYCRAEYNGGIYDIHFEEQQLRLAF